MMKSITLSLILLVVSGSSLFAQESNDQPYPTDHLKQGFVHTVFFWLEDQDSEAKRDSLYQGLTMLSGIDLIEEAFIGEPADTDREVIDSSYDFSITFLFETPEDQEAYQSHPVHLAFIDTYGYLWDQVIVYDAVSRE